MHGKHISCMRGAREIYNKNHGFRACAVFDGSARRNRRANHRFRRTGTVPVLAPAASVLVPACASAHVSPRRVPRRPVPAPARPAPQPAPPRAAPGLSGNARSGRAPFLLFPLPSNLAAPLFVGDWTHSAVREGSPRPHALLCSAITTARLRGGAFQISEQHGGRYAYPATHGEHRRDSHASNG